MIPSLEGWSTKAKKAPSPHEVRMSPVDTNPVLQSLGGNCTYLEPVNIKVWSSIQFLLKTLLLIKS